MGECNPYKVEVIGSSPIAGTNTSEVFFFTIFFGSEL